MLCSYIEAAMRLARYEVLEGGEGFFGSIPPLNGVWACEHTLEACRTELISALEDWLAFQADRSMLSRLRKQSGEG
jgi:predicted RNase H-like HicB family nuclease